MQKNKTKNIIFMATLQKLRNMGPLLIIFVGLALFAFVAGDAVKLFDTHSIDTSVGSVGEKELDAMEYQELHNYFDCFCEVSGYENVPEEFRQAVTWNLLSNSALFNDYAEKLGITVTAEEVNHVLVNGKSNFIMQNPDIPVNHPFRSGQNFNMELLAEVTNMFNEQSASGNIDQTVAKFYYAWKFIEKNVVLEILENKLAAIVTDATIVNPAVAQKNFDLNNNKFTANVAIYPFDRIEIGKVEVTEEEIAASYNKEKDTNKDFFNKQETRDIKYIIKQVTPSEKDLANLKAEMTGYADTLKGGYRNLERLARISRSHNSLYFSNLLLTKNLLDPNVALSIDTMDVNEVVGPVEQTVAISQNQFINTYDVYLNIEKATVPENILIRAISIAEIGADGKKIDLAATSDSLVNLLNGGADFKAVASNYRMSFDSLEINTSNLNSIASIIDDVETQKDIYNAPEKKYIVTDLTVPNYNGKLIFSVIKKEGKTEAYNIFGIRREKVFSNETYNQEYDKFCQFVGSCKNLKELEEKASQETSSMYWVLPEKNVTTGATAIANVSKTNNFIDWIYNEETKIGDISDVKKCGNDDCFMAVSLENINFKGYKPDSTEIRPGLTIRDHAERAAKKEKYTKLAIEEMTGKSFNDLKGIAKVTIYNNVDEIEFSNAANISTTMQDEVAVAAVAAKMNIGEVSAPFEGNNGVYVIEITAKDAKNGEFNAATQKQQIEAIYNKSAMRNALFNTLDEIYPRENRVYKLF